MRLMNYIFPATVVAVVAIFSGAIYGARLSYNGYCFSQMRYLSDTEMKRAAISILLEKYPPSVVRRPLRDGVETMSAPSNPIRYRDVDEFLLLNPNCCQLNPTEKYIEGGGLTLLERITGTATNVLEAEYAVRFSDGSGITRSLNTKTYVHINSCGMPGDPWSPY